MTDFTRSEIEEMFLQMRRVIPRGWWNIYQGCLEAGFDRVQAFALVETYVLATSSTGGIQPPQASGPGTDVPEE